MVDLKSLSKAERQELAIKHYKNWQQSGLRKIEYCRQNNLKPSTFNGWCNKIQSADYKFTKIPAKTVYNLQNKEHKESDIELKINKSLTIAISEGFNPDLLRKVLDTLGVQR